MTDTIRCVELEHREGVAWLTLANGALNTFDGPQFVTLSAAIEQATADDGTKAIVLTGAGETFSAGIDRSLLDGRASKDDQRDAARGFRAVVEALIACDKPIVAAVNGAAVGIGCTLLLHCDLVLMAESARLRMPFAALGIVPEAGSSVLLPARVRWDEAMWLLLSGDWMDAARAVELGLAWRVEADDRLREATADVAAAITASDVETITSIKRLLVEGRASSVRAAFDREVDELQRLMRRPHTRPVG